MCNDTWCKCACGHEEIAAKEECRFFRMNVWMLSRGFSEESKPYLENLERCQTMSKKLVDSEAKECSRCSNLRQLPEQTKKNEVRDSDAKDDGLKGKGRERIESNQQYSDGGSPGGVLLPSPIDVYSMAESPGGVLLPSPIDSCSTTESSEGGVPLPPGWDLKIQRTREEDHAELAPIAWSPLSSEEGSDKRTDPKDLDNIEQI